VSADRSEHLQQEVTRARHDWRSGAHDVALERLLDVLAAAPAHAGALRLATGILRRQARVREAHELTARAASATAPVSPIVADLVAQLDVLATILGAELARADRAHRQQTLEALASHALAGGPPPLPELDRLHVARHLLDQMDDDSALVLLTSIREDPAATAAAHTLEARIRFDRLEIAEADRLVRTASAGRPTELLTEQLDALRALSGGWAEDEPGEDIVRRAVRNYVGEPAPTSRAEPLVVFVPGSLAVGGSETQFAVAAVLLRCCGIDVRILHADRLPASPRLV
jgi:hypothetical protein